MRAWVPPDVLMQQFVGLVAVSVHMSEAATPLGSEYLGEEDPDPEPTPAAYPIHLRAYGLGPVESNFTGTGHADRGFAGWIPCIQWVTVRPASLGLTGGVIRNEQVAGSILALGSTQTLGNADRPTYRSCR